MGLKICTKNAWRVDVMGAYIDIYLAGIFIMKPKGVHYYWHYCLVEVVVVEGKEKRISHGMYNESRPRFTL